MPYQGELASIASHYDIVKNAEVSQFLSECDYLKPPSDEEAELMAARFEVPPGRSAAKLPSRVIAVDGSFYESSINDKLPSTRIGYMKVGGLIFASETGDPLDRRYITTHRFKPLL